jgi:hypothetical protein
MEIEITTPQGIKTIVIQKFPAMDGWDIESRFREFALSNDTKLRREYTLEVLKFAEVKLAENNSQKFTTSAMIDNHLCSWQNVRTVFETVLNHNGIDPQSYAETSTMKYWEKVGETIGASMLAALSQMMGPMIEAVATEKTNEQG